MAPKSASASTNNSINAAAHHQASADPMASDDVQIAAYTHVAHLPPHGPFAFLSAASLSRQLRRGEPVAGAPPASSEQQLQGADDDGAHPQADVSAHRALSFFTAHWSADHLRLWPSFYAAAALRPSDVASMGSSSSNGDGRR